MTFMNGDPSTECYGDNCKGCDFYNRCGYIKISDPFGEQRSVSDERIKRTM